MVDTDRGRWSSATDLPAKRWVLVTGSRTAFAAVLSALLVVVAAALILADVVYVGAGSTLASLLSSGVFSGLATVVTVTLSINQLILSRVFGSPADLTDRLEGNLDFRRSIEDVADVNTSPNDPGSFLSLVATTLEQRAAQLERETANADLPDDVQADVRDVTADVIEYASHLGSGDEMDSTYEVLSLTFGTEYADHIDDVRRLSRANRATFPEGAADDLDAILELLKGIATVRQFFKTLAIQQDLASLSRELIYTGVPAIVLTYFLAQAYAGGSLAPAIPAGVFPWVVALATGVMFAPLLVLVSYILRVATVTLYTVSVGSFVPPEERVDRP